MFFDTHTHLNSDELFPSWQQHLDAFVLAWWSGLVCVWVNDTRNHRAIDIVEQARMSYPKHTFFSTAGIHPSEVSFGVLSNKDAIDTAIGLMEAFIIRHRSTIVAVGECGMDAHYPGFETHQQLQQYLFFQQALLARKYALPLVVHSRDAFDETVRVLEWFHDVAIYMHCRSYAPAQLSFLIDRFPHLWIWFCGNITYPKAVHLRDSMTLLVWHPFFGHQVHLLVETDAPWLAPQGYRDKPNTPAHIGLIYQYISAFCNVRDIELRDIIQTSRQSLFGRHGGIVS